MSFVLPFSLTVDSIQIPQVQFKRSFRHFVAASPHNNQRQYGNNAAHNASAIPLYAVGDIVTVDCDRSEDVGVVVELVDREAFLEFMRQEAMFQVSTPSSTPSGTPTVSHSSSSSSSVYGSGSHTTGGSGSTDADPDAAMLEDVRCIKHLSTPSERAKLPEKYNDEKAALEVLLPILCAVSI